MFCRSSSRPSQHCWIDQAWWSPLCSFPMSTKALLYCITVRMSFSQFVFPLPNSSSTWHFQITFLSRSELNFHSHKMTDISATRNNLIQWKHYSTVKRARVFRARQTWAHIVGLPLASNITYRSHLDWLQWFMCQLDWATEPRQLVKDRSECWCEGIFHMRLTFKLVDFESSRWLSRMWVRLIQAAEGLRRKRDWSPQRKKEFCQQTAFRLWLQH